MISSKRDRLSRFLQRRQRARKNRASLHVDALLSSERSRSMMLFATALTVTLTCLLITVYALRQSATIQSAEAAPSYTHTANFGYDIALLPSTLYRNDTISSDEAGDTFQRSQPIYAKLTQSIDVEFKYELQSQRASELIGETSVMLEVSVSDGWKKSIELQRAVPFKGSVANAVVAISVPEMQQLIARIEKETGFKPESYNLTVVPTVSIRGIVDGTSVDTVYSPAFTFQLTATEVIPQSELRQSQRVLTGNAPATDNQVGAGRLNVGIKSLRVFGGATTVLGVIVTAAIGASTFLGVGRNEGAMVQARFKTVFIEATGVDATQPMSVVDVASLQDLARLAQRDGGIVFHENIGASNSRYFVPDGATMFQYVPRIAQNGGRT